MYQILELSILIRNNRHKYNNISISNYKEIKIIKIEFLLHFIYTPYFDILHAVK